METSADPPVELDEISGTVGAPGGGPGPAGGLDPCSAALCNDHRDKDSYSDPADQRLRLQQQDNGSLPVNR